MWKPDQILSIIPARGGSKAIPRKNLATVHGEPLIVHTIKHSLTCELIGRTVVSTDDEEIAEVALGAGAEVIRRPSAISGDDASSESALHHVLDDLKLRTRYTPEVVVFLQATSPLRPAGSIANALRQFDAEGADSLFSASPIQGFIWAESGGRVRPLGHDPASRRRRQELQEALVEENGSIYIFKTSMFARTGNRLGGKIAVFCMDRLCGLQVDEPVDISILGRVLPLSSRR
jgi:N-acylneuraminate cytidylyltransferase